MAKADPLKSEGARKERAAGLAAVRRLKKTVAADPWALAVCQKMEAFHLGRQKRYDAKPGGLGKK